MQKLQKRRIASKMFGFLTEGRGDEVCGYVGWGMWGGGVAEDLVTTRKPTTTEKNQDGSQDIVVCCLRLQSESG